MYLKKIEVKGFKSFYNKIEIPFPEGVVSVVGPNGSGKSNIADAIRWVLGEQSMKSLRGERLEDIIFNGSDTKKPLGYAEVSLYLDNEDETLNIDYSEVVIKRVVYRSGESSFYINGQTCRLKDIKELLLDTGVGKEGYSIIGQGRIEEILSSNSNNRRKILEEASGISKYRYKKEESEKKLVAVREDLERIMDIYLEIEKQINPLKLQSEKAKKYIRLKEEIKDMDIWLIGQETNRLSQLLEKEEEVLKQKLEYIKQREDEKQENSSHMETFKEELTQMESEEDEKAKELLETERILGELRGSVGNLEEKLKNIISNKKRIEFQNEEIQDDLKHSTLKLSDLTKEKEELEKSLQDIKNEGLQEERRFQELQNKLNENDKKIEELKNEILNVMDKKNNLENVKSSKETSLGHIQNRIAELTKDQENLKTELVVKIDKSKEDDEYTRELQARIANRRQMLLDFEEKIKEGNKKLQDISNSIHQVQIETREKESNLKLYESMEKEMEGFNRGVKELLKNGETPGILDVVGNIIRVDEKYEVAVEVALGGGLQNIITKDSTSAKRAIEYLKKRNLGRVTFLPLDIVKGEELSNIPEGAFLASKLVEAPNEYQSIVKHLLGRTLIIQNMDEGIEITKKYGAKYRMVTLEGEVFNPGGALTGGSIRNEKHILSRKRLIEETKEAILKFKQDEDDFNRGKEELSKQLHSIQEEARKLIDLKGKDKEELTVKETQRGIALRELESLKKKEIELEEGIEKLKLQLQTEELEIKELEEKIDKEKEVIGKIEEEVESRSSQREPIKSELEDLQLILRDKKSQEASWSQKYKSLEEKLEELKNEAQKLKENMAKGIAELEKLEVESEEAQKMKSLQVKELETTEARQESMKLELEEAKLKKEEIKAKIQTLTTRLSEIQNEISKVLESKIRLEMKISSIIEDKRAIIERLEEVYNLLLEDIKDQLQEEKKATKKELEEKKREIESLGSVNLDSIDEYEKVSERYEFYKNQKADLEKSLDSLEGLIKSLESNMREEFKKSFSQIQENYQKVFEKLFGGGKGELTIEEGQDILGGDIEIIAQPPGKKLRHISLLSGGEKALAAIALLFALLLQRPTPFCILDEIEAPLDDANIFRFVGFLKELSKQTQFITITHRRGTMEGSDYIYGVTMEEKGVSKVVSLKLNQAQEFIEK